MKKQISKFIEIGKNSRFVMPENSDIILSILIIKNCIIQVVCHENIDKIT